MLELTEEQGQVLDQHAGGPLEVIDPRTGRVYLLVAAEPSAREPELPRREPDGSSIEIPPLIARSQEAYRRDLPRLLMDRKLRGKFIAYTGDERIGIADDDADLIRECIRRGLPNDHYYVEVIEPLLLPEVEEVEYGLLEFDEFD